MIAGSRRSWWNAALIAGLLLAPPRALGEEPHADEEGATHAGHEQHGKKDGHHSSALSDEYIPLQLEGFPERPRYLLELGNPYLGTGRIKPGIHLPTGAVWQPSLILFGTLRTALQSFDADGTRFTELASRLDLFANLQLSGTERLVVGFRTFDQEGRFTSYILEPDPGDPAFRAAFGDDGDRFREELNAEIQSLYFEGDFGEIFPKLDADDFGRSDVGFSIGRQPLLFQDGILIQDSIDGIGLTRNTLLPQGTSNFRATLFVGTNEVHRANVEDRDAEMFALLTSTDVRRSTVDADLVYVRGGETTGDLVAGGVSFVQRIGTRNTTFRLLGSHAVDQETAQAPDGALFFGELSWTPHYTDDLIYFTGFVAVDEFSSAARGPASGGPLGRAGINFAAVGLGSYGAPLSSRARDVAGGAFGYQRFYGPAKRRQLLAEVGLRVGTADDVSDSVAATVRYQMAVGRRLVLVWDGFAARRQGDLVLVPGQSPALQRAPDVDLYGGRFELVVKF
ncbi:MAG: hypothetical protein ACE5EG_02375 [Thermoanaerobaculia bacterium]